MLCNLNPSIFKSCVSMLSYLFHTITYLRCFVEIISFIVSFARSWYSFIQFCCVVLWVWWVNFDSYAVVSREFELKLCLLVQQWYYTLLHVLRRSIMSWLQLTISFDCTRILINQSFGLFPIFFELQHILKNYLFSCKEVEIFLKYSK